MEYYNKRLALDILVLRKDHSLAALERGIEDGVDLLKLKGILKSFPFFIFFFYSFSSLKDSIWKSLS